MRNPRGACGGGRRVVCIGIAEAASGRGGFVPWRDEGMKVEDLIAEAISLPLEERAVLVDSLLRSLNAPDEGTEKEWLAEARRRLDEVRSGAARTIPADEVFAALGERFAG